MGVILADGDMRHHQSDLSAADLKDATLEKPVQHLLIHLPPVLLSRSQLPSSAPCLAPGTYPCMRWPPSAWHHAAALPTQPSCFRAAAGLYSPLHLCDLAGCLP